LLESLEVSEVLLSEIDLNDRYDAENFSKEYLRVDNLLAHKPTTKLEKLGSLVASAFYPAATHLYEIGDTPLIRCTDCINYPFITNHQENDFARLTQDFINTENGLSVVKKGEIVITKNIIFA